MIPPTIKIKKLKLISLAILLLIISIIYYFVKIDDIPRQNIHSDLPEISYPEENFFENSSLIIGKLDIKVPIVLDVDGSDRNLYNQKLEGGVAQMMGTAKSGSDGNIIIFGHSSADWRYKGQYGEIFSTLNNLELGDQILIADDSGREDRYSVIEKKIVMPDEVDILDQSFDNYLTLLTCWPVGSNDKRLVIISEKDD